MKRIGAVPGFAAIAVIILLAFSPPSAWAGFEEGVRAYKNGDYATALKEFRPLGEQGHPKAQYYLGAMYYAGEGVSQDFAETLKWWRRSADQGDVQGQNSLGFLYSTGQGAPRDQAEALKWYRLAANQGHAQAQHNLGVNYEFGQGVPKDFAEAIKWYRLAANQGHADAQHNLGRMYYYGKGVTQDFAESIKWDRLAADQGNTEAQEILGYMYETGLGVPRDRGEAIKWYLKARGLWPELMGSFWLALLCVGGALLALLFIAGIAVRKRKSVAERLTPESPSIATDGSHDSNRVASRPFEVLLGSVAGLIGLGLLMLFALGVLGALLESQAPDISFAISFVVTAGVGAFLALVSYRLLTKRGARAGGGLLSPTGWKVMGGMFSALTVLFASSAWQSGDLTLLSAIFLSIVFAGWCFLTATRLEKKPEK